MTARWVPGSTYRVQLHAGFKFDDAAALVPYLARLGVDTLYTSPFLRARPESTHGYDVSDHSQLNPALGSEVGFARLAARLKTRELGLLVDVVPNHMGIGEPSNGWWMDVLENGPSSIYADYFDVDWRPIGTDIDDRVLLPILGDHYGRVLEDGQIRLAFEGGRFLFYYWETQLPTSPRSYSRILTPARERLGEGSGDDAVMELESILTAIRNLPAHHERDPERRRERHREAEVIRRRIASLVEASPAVARAIEETVAELNGRPGDPHSFDQLHALLNAQTYRLAFWRTAPEEINYRRFFDINDLAAIRMENEEVFQATHRVLFDLVERGDAQGFRIDHPDGLWDPGAYFRRLQHQRPGLYVAIEKIVAAGEQIPSDWPVDGTVGYEFLNAVNALFVDGRNRRRFDQLYERFVDRPMEFETIAYESKRLICQASLAAETNTLAIHLKRFADGSRHYRDFPLYHLRFAIREVIACFPVYRTYVDENTVTVDPRDRARVDEAVACAKRRNPALDPSVFDFIARVLTLEAAEPEHPDAWEAQRRWTMKFQQTTGPVAAKGIEDTAFYVFNRLVALNEVGGEPDRFGGSVDDFHRLNLERSIAWPHGLSSSSTHDTKRSEDARARIAVLSEMPNELGRALTRWSRRNRRKRTRVDGELAPDANEEYLLYQTLVGVWPLESPQKAARDELAERLVAYMAKATREAKQNTSWINPNEEWDAAVASFVRAMLADESFVADFEPLQARVAHYGMYNSLSQLVLKMASPGVPDVYQGQELWDFSLVDPDNRRPVDYQVRRELLSELRRHADPAELLKHWRDGRIKLWVTHRALDLRRRRRELFRDGDYRPLTGHDHAVAFARTLGDEVAIAVAPRLIVGLTPDPAHPPLGVPVWGESSLAAPPGRYRDAFTRRALSVGDEGLQLADALAVLPVALLERLG